MTVADNQVDDKTASRGIAFGPPVTLAHAARTMAITPTPGWKTSEFWLRLAALILTAMYASNVIPTSGQAAQLAAMGATLLGELGYTVGRSLVKASAIKARSAMNVSNVANTAAVVVLLAMLGLGAGATVSQGCATTTPVVTTTGSGSGSATSTPGFLECSTADLTKVVSDVPLLIEIGRDLLMSDPGDAIAALIKQLGPGLVGCAVLAVEGVDSTLVTPTPHTSTNATAPSLVKIRLDHAHALMTKYGWRRR